VASLAPNSFGVYDLYGNVWEWCEDFWDPVRSPDSIFDPYGPARALMRVVRGGSFASTTSSWGREYRSAMDPSYKSRFTGFRVVIGATGNRIPAAHPASADWFARYNQRPPGYERSTGRLSPLASPAELKSKWASILNEPRFPSGSVPTRFIAEMSPHNFHGSLFEIETEPGVWEKIYVLRPANRTGKPLPVVIVPFYDIDVPAGADLGGRNYSGVGVNAFAYSAAQRGYIAVAVRWFGESDGESPSEAVANLAIRHPGATGLGKWIADARRVVDFIQTLPGADPSRIAIFGHSLGGKMALYAAAFEPRITAAVASEPGIAFKFSNYEDYWYLCDRLQSAPAGTDQHELLALIAPRPFLLIGGDKYDTSESWNYINAARRAYELLGKPLNIGYFNHHSGHTPSPESVSAAFDWLDHFLQ
jgi:pimeloyl-ACP methyl ester carboxylesterase